MKLHIVIVAINNAQMTRDAIDSIISPLDFMVHLVDQESREQFNIQGPPIRYTRFSPRVTLSQAWNTGIIQALEDQECQYILIPNNDILFHRLTIKNLLSGIDNLGYVMVTGENVAPRYSIEDFYKIENPGDIDFDRRPITNWREEGPDFSCFMIRRDFTQKIGFFDENFSPAYCEDQDMHVRIIKNGQHAKRLSTAPYFHFGSRTLMNNQDLGVIISEGHNVNKGYYRKKWGNIHPEVLDGKGYDRPFNKPESSLRFWKGYEKYETQSEAGSGL